jgi:DNA repair protein RecO (recombination protein O)
LGKYCPETPYFILKEGHFAKYKPDDELYLDQPMSQTFDFLLRIPIEESGSVSLSSDTRRKLLENIIAYFQLHLIGFGNIKSLDVLTQLFHS